MRNMIVIGSFVILFLWLSYIVAVEKGRIRPVALNDYLKLAGGLVIFFCVGASLTATQSFLSGETGNSDFHFRRGSLIRSEKHPGLAMYVVTKWFGIVEEGRWMAKEIPEKEQEGLGEGDPTWRYRDKRGRWQDVPVWISSPDAYSDDREGYTDNRGFHEY